MICAIIQARTGSSRLPNKVLLDLKGQSVLSHVVNRAKQSKLIEKVMVATTVNPNDDAIITECEKIGVQCYRGSELDVLDRFKQGISLSDASHVVRLTSDCPVIVPEIIDMVIKKHLKEDNDYTTNALEDGSYPEGYDVSICKASALYEAWKNAKLPSERQHVMPYIINNPIKYKIAELRYKEYLGHIRLTLDEARDYEVLKLVFDELYDKNNFFGLSEIIDLYQRKPEIFKINSSIIRNEGYKKDLEKEKGVI